MLALLALALSLSPLAFAAPHNSDREPTIAAFAGKHSCPSNMRPFHASSAILIPGVTAERVWREVGSFCDVEWQGFEITSVSGACDSHRSLRTYRAADLELTERLDLIHVPVVPKHNPLIPVMFSRSKRAAAPPQVFAHGITMLNRPNLAGADVIRMKTLLKVAEVDAGARVSWDVIGCSDYPEHLADKLEEVHEGALWAIEARIAQNGMRIMEQMVDDAL